MSLNANQIQTLVAAMDRAIPADDYPSASQAGVLDYFTRQFTQDLKPLLPAYESGLDSLDQEAALRFNQSFAALTPDQQDSLLHDLEQGVTQAEWQTSARQFFQMLVHHASEGYYADPGNGGNRNAISWEMIGFKIIETDHREVAP